MKRLEVYDTDETMRFRVQSDSDPAKQYLVDLLENDGLGACECFHYHFKIYPNQRKAQILGKETPGERLECKHIRAANDHWSKQARRHGSRKYHREPI